VKNFKKNLQKIGGNFKILEMNFQKLAAEKIRGKI